MHLRPSVIFFYEQIPPTPPKKKTQKKEYGIWRIPFITWSGFESEYATSIDVLCLRDLVYLIETSSYIRDTKKQNSSVLGDVPEKKHDHLGERLLWCAPVVWLDFVFVVSVLWWWSCETTGLHGYESGRRYPHSVDTATGMALMCLISVHCFCFSLLAQTLGNHWICVHLWFSTFECFPWS